MKSLALLPVFTQPLPLRSAALVLLSAAADTEQLVTP